MNWKLLTIGFLLHIVLFYSIFDIYFTSPIIHGVPHHTNLLAPPSKRLVLFSSDGLRADSVFNLYLNKSNNPFLRNVMEKKGRWGISHTRVPTESRPGHVAMIAGFYEDVSAVTKGWKENPVEFDSVFNQSKQTLAWGSPDILPMFSKGSVENRVLIHTYPSETESFAKSDFTALDTWVFKEFVAYLQQHLVNETMKNRLKESDGLIFFLHLLALDTTGHVDKPRSSDYRKGLRVVDRGVKQVVEVMENLFDNDGKTSYIFTSDHGMTDWGSHGAGSPAETQTPFIAWGAGVKKPGTDPLSHPYDLQQADICVLMSTLLGLPISLQSVGIVPFEILDANEEFKAHSVFTNIKQLYEQYKAKMIEKKSTTFSIFFSPFRLHQEITFRVQKMDVLLKKKDFLYVISFGRDLMASILDGVRYYHSYERSQLGLCVCLSYVGWMFYIASLLLQHNLERDNKEHQKSLYNEGPQKYFQSHLLSQFSQKTQRSINLVFMFMTVILVFCLYAQSRPSMHYVYFLTSLCMWYMAVSRGKLLWKLLKILSENILYILILVLFIEAMVLSFSQREVLTAVILSMSVWALAKKHYLFFFSCVVSCIFPLLPTVEKISNYNHVYLSCLLALACFGVVLWRIYGKIRTIPVVLRLQLILIGLSGYLVWWFVKQREDNKSPSPSYFNMHSFSWMILGMSFTLPLLLPSNIKVRMLSISMSFCAPQVLLSIDHESLFYLVLCLLCFSWLVFECKEGDREFREYSFSENGTDERKLKREDVRRACFYLFFLIYSFFGTGNIASINSFNPISILAFVSVFNPFVMGFLCILKIFNPLQLVSCFFQAIQITIKIPAYPFFLLLIIISDFTACHFFFLIKDSGSWLEIGTSISHYVIIMAFILFHFILFTLSKFLTHTCLIVSISTKIKHLVMYLPRIFKKRQSKQSFAIF